ncbi:MAG: PBP1A family penicillin-binding protein [Candidatus Gastranaerophilales bacterium]|nr:PBP1A family penicillin-binding protein [Candidatus Gastranaerophilales bacterium]
MNSVRRKRTAYRGPKKRNIFLCFLSMCFSAFLAAIAAFNIYLASLPPISNFEDIKPNPVTTIYSADGEVIKTFTAFKFEKVSIDKIPTYLKQAVIATEDKNFYHHRGFDTMGMIRSTITNILSGSVKQGASTITQQLARILFLSNERTFDRKIKELIIAHRIEKTISKDEILEMYLNSVYLGSGVYGVQSASRTFFDKELNQLTLAEQALIAGLPQAPSIYSPFANKNAGLKRRNQVLRRMYRNKYITQEQMETAQKEGLTLSTKPRIYSFNKAPYFIDFVLNELKNIGFEEQEISQGGLKIYTTLDYKSQNVAQNTLVSTMTSAGLNKVTNQGALFSFSPTTGRIYAYIGGKNYEETQYDRVSKAIRPSGSSFKPFVYATALQQGVNIGEQIEDTPLTIQDWSPKNYGQKYRGKITIWQALAISSNVAAVRMIKQTGIDAVIQTAREMGITTPLASDMTIALGSNGVKLYDMVVAYGAFANGGFRVKPYSVERVENSRGVTIYENMGPKIIKVINFETAAGMTYMLRKVVEIGTGKAANIAPNVAGKTGTTNDYRDAWFVGYTPDIVTGVWIGNDNNSKLPGITGGSLPARIFANYLKVAIQNFPQSVFDYPNMNGEVPLSPITIEDVDEVVDESEEKMADKKVQTEAQKQVVEEPKKQEVKKQEKPKQKEVAQPKKAFEVNRSDLIEYDDEKVNNSAVPLPGM